MAEKSKSNKKNKITTRIVDIPIYKGKLRIDIVDHPTESDFWKDQQCPCKKCPANGGTHFAGQCAVWNGKGIRMMLVRTRGGLTPPIYAHEAFHATHMIFDNVGAHQDSKNPEPQAYLLSWVVEQCCKAKKTDRKTNRKKKTAKANKKVLTKNLDDPIDYSGSLFLT